MRRSALLLSLVTLLASARCGPEVSQPEGKSESTAVDAIRSARLGRIRDRVLKVTNASIELVALSQADLVTFSLFADKGINPCEFRFYKSGRAECSQWECPAGPEAWESRERVDAGIAIVSNPRESMRLEADGDLRYPIVERQAPWWSPTDEIEVSIGGGEFVPAFYARYSPPRVVTLTQPVFAGDQTTIDTSRDVTLSWEVSGPSCPEQRELSDLSFNIYSDVDEHTSSYRFVRCDVPISEQGLTIPRQLLNHLPEGPGAVSAIVRVGNATTGRPRSDSLDRPAKTERFIELLSFANQGGQELAEFPVLLE